MKKEANIKNVAQVAGVSISTVSRVLNQSAGVREDLKERVYRAIEETEYTINPIASTLKSAKRNQIAIVLPSLKQTYYTDVIKGISDYCYRRQVMPVILESCGSLEKEEDVIRSLEKEWVDGIILIPGIKETNSAYHKYVDSLHCLSKQKTPIPVILTESNDVNENLDSVRVDYIAAFYGATSHMLEIGRKHIAYLSCPEEAPLYSFCIEGVEKAHLEYGVELSTSLVVCGNYTVLDGYHSMKRLIELGYEIDGVVCSNDQVASGALHACKENNIQIPRQITITGYGGVALSIITTPSISTMISPRYELGEKAAQLLFERIDGYNGTPRKLLLTSYLAIRESTLKTAVKKMDMLFEE